MKKGIKKVSAFLLAVLLSCALAACGGGAGQTSPNGSETNPPPSAEAGAQTSKPDDTVYNVTVELNYPEPAAGVLNQYFSDLEELSGGRLDFDIYYGYSLNGESGVLDALQSGIVQVIGFMPYTQETQFPYSGALFNMPFLGFEDMESTTEIWWQMYESTPEMQAEYERAGLTVAASIANPIYDLHFKAKNVNVRIPSDMNGMSIITSVPEIQAIVNQAGAAPIESGPGDYYSNLDKGVAEGIIQHINILTSFGVNPEVLGTHVRFEESGGGFATSIMQLVWSTEFLNGLPEDLQRIIQERSATLGDEMVANDSALVETNYKLAEDKGATILFLTEEEGQAWRDAAAPVLQASLQDYVNEGAAAMFDVYHKLEETVQAYYNG